MPRLSTLSNPTGLVDLEKHRITITLDEAAKRTEFCLARLDLTGVDLPAGCRVVVVARRGNAEERIELGTVANYSKGFIPLTELPDEGTWLFRVLVVHPDTAKLAAAAENIRPQGQGDSESFIALEAAELGQRPWDIVLLEQDGRVVVRFNRDIYRSPAEADADQVFVGMLLHEAVRRLASHIAEQPGCLEEAAWKPVQDWLLHLRTGEVPDADSQAAREEWCNLVVDTFCNRFEFANRLRDLRRKENDE